MHARGYVRMPRVAVPNHDQTHLINHTFTDPGKFKAVHSVAMLICIAHVAAVFQTPRVIITFHSDVGEKSRVVTPLGESICSCGTLKPESSLWGIHYRRVENV